LRKEQITISENEIGDRASSGLSSSVHYEEGKKTSAREQGKRNGKNQNLGEDYKGKKRRQANKIKGRGGNSVGSRLRRQGKSGRTILGVKSKEETSRGGGNN